MHNVKQLVRACIRVVLTSIRLGVGKLFHGRSLQFGFPTCLAMSDTVEMAKNARLLFGRGLRTRGGCLFNVQESGSLEFGSDVFINRNCMFNCRERIAIGEGTEFGPGVMLFDHDHEYRTGNIGEKAFISSPIIIGKNCWIGAGVIILRGTTVGDNAVIAAGSVLKGAYPSDTLVLQRRITDVSKWKE